jgi:DNA-binding PadR family transcriptional regulator
MSQPDDFLPLTPTVFEILLALADGQRHGYAIILEVERRTGGGVELRPGSLYRALHRLIRQGLILESEERPDEDDERRRYYSLTSLGRRVARAEARRLARAVEGARQKRLLRPGEAAK